MEQYVSYMSKGFVLELRCQEDVVGLEIQGSMLITRYIIEHHLIFLS